MTDMTTTPPTTTRDALAQDQNTVQVFLNGAPMACAVRTLQELLVAHGYDMSSVATAVNGDFVPAAHRDTLTLKAGDRIEVVAPRQGG
jgi:sulfur carrier protein